MQLAVYGSNRCLAIARLLRWLQAHPFLLLHWLQPRLLQAHPPLLLQAVLNASWSYATLATS